VRAVLDAAGAGVVPVGGVEAGLGGTAPDAGPPPAALAVAGSLAAGAGLLLVAARRTGGRPRHAGSARHR
jgi:hypothetical protein